MIEVKRADPEKGVGHSRGMRSVVRTGWKECLNSVIGPHDDDEARTPVIFSTQPAPLFLTLDVAWQLTKAACRRGAVAFGRDYRI
jgi:hypothetical protein